MATYVTCDIHNNYHGFVKMLNQIHFTKEDRLLLLGDIFDRSDHDNPNPVDLYFKILSLQDSHSCFVVAGNHDRALADYVQKYYSYPEKHRKDIPAYSYSTFELLQSRLTPMDIQNLASTIMSWPLQLEIKVNEEKFLLAHAATAPPGEMHSYSDSYFLEGTDNKSYYKNGVDGYTSILGHFGTPNGRIRKNEKSNIYLLNTGSGYKSGKLACLCLDNKQEFYV